MEYTRNTIFNQGHKGAIVCLLNFIFLCLMLLWLYVFTETLEKRTTVAIFGIFALFVVVLIFLFKVFILPLHRCIEQQMAIGQELEEKYRQSLKDARQLATAVEQSADSVIITDTQGKILYVNPAFYHLTGYSSMEVIGQNPSIVKSEETTDAIYQDLCNRLDPPTRSPVLWH